MMLASVIRSPMSFFDTTPIGRVLNRFAKDMYTVDESIPDTIGMVLTMFMSVSPLFSLNFLFTQLSVHLNHHCNLYCNTIFPDGDSTSWGILLLRPAVLRLVLCSGHLVFNRPLVASSRQLKRLDGVTRSPIYANFSETLNGVSTIRAFKKEANFINLVGD